MSEINNQVTEPATEPTPEPTPVVSTSKVNLALESVINAINAMNNFATMTRGALGSNAGLSCEISPSVASEVYLDKNSYLTVTLALNGKNADLRVLTDTMNNIIDTMTRAKSYYSGNGWEVVDISSGNLTRVIGRESNNLWLVACDLIVKIYRKDDTTNESGMGE